MDYTDISIAHIHTTLAPKTTFGEYEHKIAVSVTAVILFWDSTKIYLRIITQPLP